MHTGCACVEVTPSCTNKDHLSVPPTAQISVRDAHRVCVCVFFVFAVLTVGSWCVLRWWMHGGVSARPRPRDCSALDAGRDVRVA